MQVAVWDTYVTKKDGGVMHFDIVAPSHIEYANIIFTFGKDYLLSKNQQEQPITAKQCSFCHIEQATVEMEMNINKKGYYIIEMENCN